MITGRIFEWAERAPERMAVVFNGRAFSYRAFTALIAQARGFFARRGYVGGGYAILALNNRMDFWVISLALRSLGLTTISLPTAADLRRLGLPNVRCVAASPGENWPGLTQACAALGHDLVAVSLHGESPLGLEGGEHDPPGGHILQTSGTTGVFKKVLMDPAWEEGYIRIRSDLYGLGEETVFSLFDFAGWTGAGYKSAVATWSVGGGVILQQGGEPYLGLLNPKITHATLIPAMLATILATPEGAFPRNERMDLAVTGGTITQTQIDQARARITPQLYNRLGSTESSTFGFTLLETEDDHRWHHLVPGRVVQIVDDQDRPVPVGQLGRVRVSTDGGPNSYLYDEEATRAFFKDGFFYPGDLAFMRADGRMALQGRSTEVINLNGHKVQPSPIEDRIRQAFGVSGVCLVSMQDSAGEEEVHVVVETKEAVDVDRLVAVLYEELRGPIRIRIHQALALPRNNMGKVQRDQVRADLTARLGAGR